MIGQHAGYGLTKCFGGTCSNDASRSGIDVHNPGMCVCDNYAGAHAIDDRVARRWWDAPRFWAVPPLV
jgi:hypothetical protein